MGEFIMPACPRSRYVGIVWWYELDADVSYRSIWISRKRGYRTEVTGACTHSATRMRHSSLPTRYVDIIWRYGLCFDMSYTGFESHDILLSGERGSSRMVFIMSLGMWGILWWSEYDADVSCRGSTRHMEFPRTGLSIGDHGH